MTWSDLATLVQTAGQRVFGEAATYTPAGGGVSEEITGIFEGAAERVTLDRGIEIQTTVPILTVHLADLAVAPEQGSTVHVRSEVYDVVGVEPDGQGDAALILTRG